MILYDSHQWSTLFRFHGSVLPRAMLSALPSALIAVGVKALEMNGLANMNSFKVLTEGSIYSGFTFVLGFSLVFRTSQSYARYWTAATSAHEMGSEWADACASILSFSSCSKRPQDEVMYFMHTMVRLFSLLHALALEEISSMEDADFPLIDVSSFSKKDLSILISEAAQGRKMQVIMNWIKVCLLQNYESGVLNVPAPILTRVFQEIGMGLVNYHKAQQVVIWPFPFPYTQLNLLLLYVYMLVTPLVVCIYEATPWLCIVYTYVSVICMVGLDLIASELENPFGDDPNDLPGLEMQDAFNKGLLLMLQPSNWVPPRLHQSTSLDHETLLADYVGHKVSLAQVTKTSSIARRLRTARSNKIEEQQHWSRQRWPAKKLEKLHRWLKLSQRDSEEDLDVQETDDSVVLELDEAEAPCNVGPSATQDSVASVTPPTHKSLSSSRLALSADTGCVLQCSATTPPCPVSSTLQETLSPGPAAAQRPATQEEQPWDDFLESLTAELKQHMQRQFQHQEELLRCQLSVQECFVMELVRRLPRASDSSSRGMTPEANVARGNLGFSLGVEDSRTAGKAPVVSAFRAEVLRRQAPRPEEPAQISIL